MRDNTITAVAGEKMYIKTDCAVQYDHGLKLIITGIQLPAEYDVHFCNTNSHETKTQTGDSNGVDIPDEYLLNGEDIHAWLYLHASDSDGESVYHIHIPVTHRAAIGEEQITPIEHDVIREAIERLNEAVAETQSNVEHYPRINDNSTWEVWDAENEEWVDTEISATGDQGEQGDPGDPGVGIESITLNEDYTLTFTLTDGTEITVPSIRGEKGEQGDPGVNGQDGYTPVKGVDYFDGQDGHDGRDGVDGYTPIKGTDYFDGQDGQDGHDGQDGFSPVVSVETITGGHRVTITDSSGAVPFDVMDGVTAIDDTVTSVEKAWSSKKTSDELDDKADKTDTVLETTLSRGRVANSTVGTASVAFGNNCTASGEGSQAFGDGTNASGFASHAEGSGCQATGFQAHAEGAGTQATGTQAHAEGAGTQATGNLSHAEGAGTQAIGTNSHAEGGGTIASGTYSHAEGQATIAAGADSHVSGKDNIADSYDNWTEWTPGETCTVGMKRKRTSVIDEETVVEGFVCKTDNSDTDWTPMHWTNQYGVMNYAEIIGNGKDTSNRSNARVLDWDGNERLMGDVYVGCNPDSSGGTKLLKETDIVFATDAHTNALFDD